MDEHCSSPSRHSISRTWTWPRYFNGGYTSGEYLLHTDLNTLLILSSLQVISQLTTKLHVQMQIHLVETSLSMRELQKEKLQAISQQHHCEIHWHDTINDIPPSSGEYTMLVAHEFFDALPIHVVQVYSSTSIS